MPSSGPIECVRSLCLHRNGLDPTIASIAPMELVLRDRYRVSPVSFNRRCRRPKCLRGRENVTLNLWGDTCLRKGLSGCGKGIKERGKLTV